MDGRVSLDQFERAAAALVAASSPSEVFRTLLGSSGLGAPRVSIFLLRQGRLRGWGCTGYAPELNRRVRTLSAPGDEGWLGRVATKPQGRLDFRQAGEKAPDFGQPEAREAVAVPVCVGRRTVAILVAERADEQGPWEPAVLGALVTIARVRLDLDVARRRLKSYAAQTAAPEPPQPEDRDAAPLAMPASPEAPAGSEERASRSAPTELAPAPEAPAARAGASAKDNAQRASAQRYARLIATDIRLYNEETVMLGRRHGDLAKRLGEHLNRGRETFLRRYSDLGPQGLQILHEAYVQVLAGGDKELLPAPESE